MCIWKYTYVFFAPCASFENLNTFLRISLIHLQSCSFDSFSSDLLRLEAVCQIIRRFKIKMIFQVGKIPKLSMIVSHSGGVVTSSKVKLLRKNCVNLARHLKQITFSAKRARKTQSVTG